MLTYALPSFLQPSLLLRGRGVGLGLLRSPEGLPLTDYKLLKYQAGTKGSFVALDQQKT